MAVEIAVATLNSRLYFEVVSELKKRGLQFHSLKPTDDIPTEVRVVITSPEESGLIRHDIILAHQGRTEETVDRAIRLASGKQTYDKLSIGIDPGLTYGVVAVGDGKTLRSRICVSPKEVVQEVSGTLDRFEARARAVRIGRGSDSSQTELIRQIKKRLPFDVSLELVDEQRTSVVGRSPFRTGPRDVESAFRIALRKGRRVLG